MRSGTERVGRKPSEAYSIKRGRGLVDRKLVEAPSNLIAGHPKAALLDWFFGDFRCGALLFMVILVTYKYKNR